MPELTSRQQLFETARCRADLTLDELWISYLALGGTHLVPDLKRYLSGRMLLPPGQQDVLACALNERLADRSDTTRVPYLTVLPDRCEEALEVLCTRLRPGARDAPATTERPNRPQVPASRDANSYPNDFGLGTRNAPPERHKQHGFVNSRSNLAVTAPSTTPLNSHTIPAGPGVAGEIPLNPPLRGKIRVPGRTAPPFDLNAFSQALEQHHVNYQFTRYAPDADIRIVDPNHPPTTPRIVHGASAIYAWLFDASVRNLDLHVTHLVDGGDRVAFTQCWHHADGTEVVATSTAELQDGRITTQHTILAWGTVAGTV